MARKRLTARTGSARMWLTVYGLDAGTLPIIRGRLLEILPGAMMNEGSTVIRELGTPVSGRAAAIGRRARRYCPQRVKNDEMHRHVLLAPSTPWLLARLTISSTVRGGSAEVLAAGGASGTGSAAAAL